MKIRNGMVVVTRKGHRPVAVASVEAVERMLRDMREHLKTTGPLDERQSALLMQQSRAKLEEQRETIAALREAVIEVRELLERSMSSLRARDKERIANAIAKLEEVTR